MDTWSDVERELARLAGRPDAPIVDVLVADAGLLTHRPKFAALLNERLRALSIEMPTWHNELARYVEARRAG